MRFVLFVFLFGSLTAGEKEEVQDQRFQVGDFRLENDKEAHFFGGFAVYSIADKTTKLTPVKYGVVFLFAAGKEIWDSWHTVGDLADFTYAMGGGLACHLTLKILRLENKNIKIGVKKDKVLIAWKF